MWFLLLIIHYFESISNYFYDAYLEVNGWVFPFYYLATPLYWVYYTFKWISERFVDFNDWCIYIQERVKAILSEWDIWSFLSVPIQWATDAWDWVVNATLNVWTIITDWWSTFSYVVRGWIDITEQWLFDRIEEVKALANKTQSDLTNFFTVTLPQLVGYGELDSIIISYLRTWFPMYNSFCLLWDNIEEFFANPLEWLYNKLDEFFERYW